MYLIWIDGRHKRNYERFEFDKNFFNDLFDSAVWFWEKNVLADIPPDPKTAADMLKLWNSHNIGETVMADDNDVRNYLQLKILKEQIKILEKNKIELEDSLKIKIKQAEGLVDETGKIICTWKSQKRLQFLTEKFKKEQPELYNEYSDEKTIRKLT